MMALERENKLHGEILRDEPMADHTSWRTGGPAKIMYKPADRADLVLFLQSLTDSEAVIFLGLGSNLLVRDGGVNATVICLHGALTDISLIGDGRIYAEAGVPCAQLARFAAQSNLSGNEFFAGIPGTVGGALAMNAGAFGAETWQYVEQVESVDRSGRIHTRTPAEYDIQYRQVIAPQEEWFLSGLFRFAPGNAHAGKAKIRELLNKRNLTQPIGVHSCGSVFRNPPGDYAARLVEAAGLKGYRIGGAQVSEKHANFIVNDAAASAGDIEELIRYVQAKVEAVHGIRLQPEVHIIGEPV